MVFMSLENDSRDNPAAPLPNLGGEFLLLYRACLTRRPPEVGSAWKGPEVGNPGTLEDSGRDLFEVRVFSFEEIVSLEQESGRGR
jgi:hypothetical protein